MEDLNSMFNLVLTQKKSISWESSIKYMTHRYVKNLRTTGTKKRTNSSKLETGKIKYHC
jgi:hypothetical protein